MTENSFDRTLLADVDPVTIEANPGATIVPAQREPGGVGADTLATLSRETESQERLELLGTIGEGGMGVVRLAVQRALGREVAVKTLKPYQVSESATTKLLREAWVTGSLEHPNIVPVYDLAFDVDGSPYIVLKKIEGEEWTSFIHDAALVKERFGADDLLEWNLSILMQVCNAMRFAHSRGILHRDLKPENVMIGPFGEVYVVDWGLAVSIEDDRSGRLPLARDANAMAGTPAYMAPEMLGGTSGALSERTDVYLLGAILFEIVCGHPPHGGSTLMEIVVSVVRSQPKLAEDVPERLARIVRRAMSPEPKERHPGPAQLGLELHDFSRHRDAEKLAERAFERLGELESLFFDGAGERARGGIYKAFGECRFGFRHALEVWPNNELAKTGLERAFVSMVRFELERGEPEAAQTLLDEMTVVPAALAEKVEAATKRRAEEDAALRKLSADLDPAAGGRGRGRLALAFGLLLAAAPLLTVVIVRYDVMQLSATSHAITMASILAVVVGLGLWARRTVMRTALNRRLAMAAVLAICTQLLGSLVSLASDAPYSFVVHDTFIVSGTIVTMLCVSVDVRLMFSAATFFLVYTLLPVVGFEYVFHAASAANFVLLLNMSLLWTGWRRRAEGASSRSSTSG